MIVLTVSAAPIRINANMASVTLRAAPKTIVASPNPTTASINTFPWRRISRSWDMINAATMAPMACAAESHP